MYVTPDDQPKKFQLTPASAKDFELAPVTAEAFVPENLGGIEPESPEKRAGLLENIGKRFSATIYDLAKGVTELPQWQEATQNTYVQGLAKAYINRQVKKGKVDAKEAEYYKNNMSEWIPKMGFILPAQPGEETIGEKLARSGANQWLGKTAEQLREDANRYDKGVTAYLKSGEYGKALGAELTAIIESAPYTIAAAFGGPMGAAGLGAVVGSQTYDEVKDREDMTEAMKLVDATSTGLWEAVFEYFGTKQAADYLKRKYATVAKDKVEDEIKNGVTGFLSKAYKKFGVWFAPVHEGTSEFATQVAQNLTARFTGEDPERSPWDGASDSFLVGMGMGTMSAAVEQGMEQIPRYYQRKTQGQAIADPDLEIKNTIDQYGQRLKFNSNIPLSQDQNPIVSIASHKLEDKKFFLTGESGAIGDHVFTAYDFDALQEAGYDLTQVRPQLIKASDIREKMDIPYQEWLQQEVNQFKQTQVQGQQMVVKAQAPVQEGQEITLGDKTFNVTFVDETGITLNEIDKQGNITGGELIVPPEDYEKVFGVPAADQGIQQGQNIAQNEPITAQDEGIQAVGAENAQTQPVQLPVNKKGEIEYDQITEPEIYAQGLTQEFGEDAPAILDELIAEQTTALEKAKKGTNAIERARKVKAINAELKKLSGVKEILTPTAIAEGPSLEAPSASPVVEQPEPEEQAIAQDLARPEEEEPVVSEMEQTPSTPDETAPVEAEMQEAGEVEQAQQPAPEKSPEVELTKANAQVDTRPTEAQKEAGNYQKGHLKLYGLDISIENPVGSIRKGTDKKGNDWAIMLNNSYGYIRKTVSPEGNDQVDVFLGDNLDSDSVYIIDQIDPDSGKFDEHKVMMGFNSAQDAKDNYLANYEPGWKGLGAITAMPLDEFKQWVYDREKTSKPLDAKVPVKGEKKADNRVAQWVDAFNKAKESNDLNAIQDVYDKVLVYLNGPAQKYGEQAVNDFTQLKGQIEAYAEEAKNKDKAKTEFAGESLDNTPRTRSLREFTKGDHVKNVKTGNEYEVVSVEKTGDVSLKKLGEKQIRKFNGKQAQWIPIQREIKAKRAKRTVKFKPDSKTGKLLSKAPQSFKELILQFFIGGGRVSHADFLRYVGWKASKAEGYIWAVKGDAEGKKEQGKAFDSFWEDAPEEWGRRGGTEDTNEIADILKTYPSITQMMDELKRLQSADESVPDRNMPSPEELGAAVSDADIEDDLSNHEDEVVGRLDDVWDNPDYQIIFDKYSTDKGLDVDKLLADINNNPEGISNLTPFGLNNKELTTLKNYLEDEQSRRKESQVPENIQGPDKDKGPDRKEDSSGSDQGDRVRRAAEEGERNEVVPPKDDIDKLNDLFTEKPKETPASKQKSPYSPIQQKQIDKINKEYSEQIAKKEAAIVQAEKDMREALLKADERNGLFGDTNPVGKDEIIKRDEQGFTYDEATQARVRKPFEEKMAELRKEIEELKLEQKGKIESVIKQQDLFADIPAEPVDSKPIDKESLPKLDDFGQKIGGARKDMEITRTARDTDSLPAWRRKYHYANADGTLNLGAPVDTSKPFIVQWAKDIDSWAGKRTVYRPVTTIDTRQNKVFNSEEEAEAYIPIYEVWKQNFRVRKSGDNYVITKTSSTNKVIEYATFPTEEEANTYMYSTEGATSLLNHKREDFSIPALDKVERTGKDWRKGKDVSTDEFMETFGFRGGEFGNWVKPEERRVMLNAAYDSFMDLAELLGVPPRSLSLSGELSIAFGARGVKGAAAHFEPDRAVINLTRMNGAGSLAHEWAHALDNYFGLQAAKKDYSRNDKGEVIAGKVMRTTADLLSVRGMRKELSEIFDKLIEATQEKSVTRKMGIDEKQKYFDKFHKSVQREADDLIKKFTNGVRRYQYNRKTKQREDVVIKATPEQVKKAKAITDKILEGKGTKPVWDRIPESKSRFGDYSYISPEMLALDALHKEVFGKTGLKRDGAGFYNLGYYGDRMYRAKETLDKALAGESETLNVPTDFLKVSREFDKSRANPYWSTKIEMFARAFEYFIESKLLDKNVRADYLQYDKAPVYDAVYGKNPYPQGEERAEINKLFQQFFDEVRVKTDENNVSLLYEKAEEYISENKVYQQARPQQDFPEGVSYLSERASGALSGQLDLFGTSNYTPTTDDGNVTYVERLISERGVTFLGEKLTGPPTIRTSADIAYLFKNLESATSENAFAVLISKTGEYKVLYLGTGSTTGVIIDSKFIIAAAKDFGAKRVVVVHNHPSGNLKPSGADMAFDRNIMSALESMDIDLDPSIIIDLDSGEFTVFAGENVDYKKYRKEDYGTDVPVEDKTIYQFEKKKLYVPASERTTVKNSADIAEYLSKMKRGTTPKLHVMILDRSLHINRYLLYDETISNEELIAGLLYEVGKHGEMVALASNTRMSPGLLVDLAAKLKKVDSDIIDFIQIKQGDDILNNYMSYADEGLISEPKVPYGKESKGPEFAGEYLESQDVTQTPAFKKWFGDSKVVDENGRPLVVYHGSPNTFDTFNLDKVGAQGSTEGHGFYFTADREIAQGYAERRDQGEGKLYEVYLKIENPYSNEKRTITKTDVRKILSLLHKKDPEYALSNYGDIAYEGLNKVLNIAVESENEAETDTDLIGSLVNGGIAPLESVLKAVYDITGKDGVITSWENGTPVFVTASPTQIKSATGNKGTFDPENPNILEEPQDPYHFAGDWLNEQPEMGPNPDLLKSAAEIYAERKAKGNLSDKIQGIREYIQDMNLPVRKFEEEVLRRGGKQDNDSKPYRDMNRSFGRQEKLYTDFFEKKMKPVLRAMEALKRAKVKGEEILPYVIAKHAIERNPIMRGEALREWVDSHKDATDDEIEAKRDELRNLDYSGVSGFDTENKYENPDELARDIVKAFEANVDKALIDNLWSAIKGATAATLDTWEAGKQISADQKKQYLERYRYFVPLRGWRHGAAKELRYTKGEGFSKSLRKAEGRKSLADNPLAYILSVQFQAISEQVDNEVRESMYNLIVKNLNNPEINELVTIRKLYHVKVKGADGTERWEETDQRPPEEMFKNGTAKTKIYREHEMLRSSRHAREHEVIVVHKPGGDMVIVFKKNMLTVAQAMNKQNYFYRTVFGNIYDARDLKAITNGMGALNNALKAMYTSWNVVFPFTNFMRDIQEASITQFIKGGGKSGLKVMYNYKNAFPAIIRNLTGEPNLNSQMDRDLQDFYTLGGATGHTHTKTIEEIEKSVNREVDRMVRKGTVLGNTANALRQSMLAINTWNQVFEDATRFSVYLSALSAGFSKEDAAIQAKEASVNFNRKGKGSKAWDAYFAFFNVALQSLQKNFALAKDHTGRFTAVAGSFVMLGFLEALMNALTDDDDKDSAYYNINPWMRQNYLIIPNLPKLLTSGEKGNKYLSIPLPQFWRGFKSVGSIAFDIATKKMSVGDGAMSALANFAAGMLPVDIGGFYRDGEFSFAPIVPTIFKPVAEVMENRNYMGYTIMNEPFTRDQKKKLAASGLGKSNVSPAAKYVTDMLFRWGGGQGKYKYYYDQEKGRDRKVPFIMDINPSGLEHLIKGYTGGTGAFFTDLLTTASQGLSSEQVIDFKNMPFVNKFFRKIPEAKWNIISEFYDLRDDSKIHADLEKDAVKEAETTGDWSTVTAMYGNEYLQRYQETFAGFESELDDAMKMKDFDIVEGNRLSVEIMERAIAEIKELKREYGKK